MVDDEESHEDDKEEEDEVKVLYLDLRAKLRVLQVQEGT